MWRKKSNSTAKTVIWYYMETRTNTYKMVLVSVMSDSQKWRT